MALIINGETIDDEIIEDEFRVIKGHYERLLQVACCERDPEFLAMAKDNISSRILLKQESYKRFPEVTEDEVSDRLSRLIEQAGGEDQFYAGIGVPVKDESLVRDNVSGGVRMEKMLKGVYEPEPEIGEESLKRHYESHQELFLTEEEIRCSHISMSLSGASSRVEVYNKMRALRKEAQGGADFDKLSLEHNSNKDQSPDLGWFKRGEFMEEFEAIAFSMEEGEISPVFTTQLGFHICRVTGRRPPVPKPFDEVRDAVRHHVLEGHRDEKFNAFVEDLKQQSQIEDTDPDADTTSVH